MKTIFALILLCVSVVSLAQVFECTGSFYLVIYKDSDGVSKLYEIKQEGGIFTFHETILSEDRRLTGLVYNVNDLHLWALDSDHLELVRLNPTGRIEIVGTIQNIDRDLEYHSGMISPKGNVYYFIGHDAGKSSDVKFYKVDLTKNEFEAEFIDISNSGLSKIQDMAVDPVFGEIYGINNHNGTIVQMGVNGQLSTLNFAPRGKQYIDALFFTRVADMYGYTNTGELYSIDIFNGRFELIRRGPEGSHADGCSCPYTYEFRKSIIPRKILQCEPFRVRYDFTNHLGISQTAIQLRDTFPEGFQIIDISGNIPYTRLQPAPPPNILALENIIYIMGTNFIEIEIQPAPEYLGSFSSQAIQQSFPLAVQSVHLSDDPATMMENDPTSAEIVNEEGISFQGLVTYNCERTLARIEAPVDEASFEWSTGSFENFIEVNTPGWYGLKMVSECLFFNDSVYIGEFPPRNSVFIGDDRIVKYGDSVNFTAQLGRDHIDSILWSIDGIPVDCHNCPGITFAPESDSRVSVFAIDSGSCKLEDEALIQVEFENNLYMPNVFSPNGDGINDYFFISSSLPGTFDLVVYNRWGNIMYAKENTPLAEDSQGWDGTFNGQYVGSGSYVWVAEIRYFDGGKEVYSGSVVVISGNH